MRNKNILTYKFTRRIVVVVILLLITQNIVLLSRIMHSKENSHNNLIQSEHNIERLSSLNDKLRFMISNNLLSESSELNPLTIFHKVNNEHEKRIKDFLTNSPVLFLRFTEFSCSVCVEQTLNKIKNLPRIFLNGKFVIIASNSNVRNLLSYMNNNNIKYPVYILEDDNLPVPLEKLNFPYLFVLDNSTKATNIF